MSTASEPDGLPAMAERRLHPLSWLFVLLQQLKQFAIPLLILLVGGRGDRDELWPLIGVGALALYSVAQYFTYRFRLEADGIVIRSGLLQKTTRHIPFDRIHNVAVHQSLLHRLFNVAEVRLESAGGQKPEGQMRVLSLADARALENLVRGHALATATDADTPSTSADGHLLLALDTREVLRLGLISNRGMYVVAAGIGALAQSGSDILGNGIKGIANSVFGWVTGSYPGTLSWIAGALLLFVLFVVVLRLLSVVLALLQFHGFRLIENGHRLVVQRGLLTHRRSSLSRRRIQSFSLSEGLLHRWFGRRSLRVDSATGAVDSGQSTLRDLVPLAAPDTMDTLIADLLPGGQWPVAAWRPLHANAWRRQFFVPALLVVPVTIVLCWWNGGVGLLALFLVPILWLRARNWARHAGYAEQAGLIAVREGWLDRNWRFADARRLQSLQLTQSPFDRRYGMATLWLDTVGASPSEPSLRIRYLPVDEARALQEKLSAQMG